MPQKPRPDRYEVLVSGKWLKTSQSHAYESGWLQYEIKAKDGTVTPGLAKPGKFRKYEAKPAKPKPPKDGSPGPKSISSLFKF